MVVGLKRLGIAGISALTVYIVFGYWGFAPDDPNINLETALAAIFPDTDRGELIRGATEDQLKTRFGYVRRVEQVSRLTGGSK
jgi:hypothetical protein